VYTYLAGTHRLGSIDGIARTYDSNGNTTDRGDGSPLVYDDRNRLAEVGSGLINLYTYTGKGERVMNMRGSATLGGTRSRSAYDEGGLLLMGRTYSSLDNLTGTTDYVYLDMMPVAQVVNGVLTYLETDHLGTPRVAADQVTNTQEWAWNFFGSAFGEHLASGTIDVKTRYPGQLLDDETDLHYNYFRDYEPSTGRYVESDPIGLRGGLVTFGYTSRSAFNSIDPFGLSGSICGAAPSYNPTAWNDGGRTQSTNNCYSYAWDRPNDTPPRPEPCRPQPGGFSCRPSFPLDCKAIIDLSIKDGMTKTNKDGSCPDCYHKVFLVISREPNPDYHWYRQDRDRSWSHKPGLGQATNLDSSGQPIPNPERADRSYPKYNYTEECGYLCAPNR
jgi:RHS repeat-associated protein